jgi:hypothetical protein
MYRTPSTTSTLAYIFYGSTNDTTCWQGTSQRAAGCAPGGGFDYLRPEGFNYGYLTFQGARAVDNASGQWTTPDAYAGDVHDPMSQKAFMWDGNNPYFFSDPSGFYPGQVGDASNHPYFSTPSPSPSPSPEPPQGSSNLLSAILAALGLVAGPIRVNVSDELRKDIGARINASNNAVKQLDEVHVNAAITEAQTGAKIKGADHIRDVQGGIDSLKKTIDHLSKMEGKYRNSPSDLAALRRLENLYTGIIRNVQRRFQAGGVSDRIEW